MPYSSQNVRKVTFLCVGKITCKKKEIYGDGFIVANTFNNEKAKTRQTKQISYQSAITHNTAPQHVSSGLNNTRGEFH